MQTHVDRCLSCLSCMTTCPSGVDYMHLVDIARVHIEETGRRSFKERIVRRLLAEMVPYPEPLPPRPQAGPARAPVAQAAAPRSA